MMHRSTASHILTVFVVAGLCLAPVSARSPRQQTGSQAGAAANPTDQSSNPSAPPSPSNESVLRSSSDLVRIDVEVTDRSGKPIKGLKADQFSLTDDGQGQKVSIFSYED